MKTNFIGIDNGVSGTIGIISDEFGVQFMTTPIKAELSYTKVKQKINRVDNMELFELLRPFSGSESLALIERPMVNSTRFKASMSAIRSLEATLIVLETLKIPYQYIDSKEWQKLLLPSGIKGTSELKKASLDIGLRLFPEFEKEIKKHKDADGLLIAEYGRKTMQYGK